MQKDKQYVYIYDYIYTYAYMYIYIYNSKHIHKIDKNPIFCLSLFSCSSLCARGFFDLQRCMPHWEGVRFQELVDLFENVLAINQHGIIGI